MISALILFPKTPSMILHLQQTFNKTYNKKCPTLLVIGGSMDKSTVNLDAALTLAAKLTILPQ